MIAHNSSNYDSHFILKNFTKFKRTANNIINAINTSGEKTISFSIGNFKFIDSCRFLSSSLDSLAKKQKDFPRLRAYCAAKNLPYEWLSRKMVYPYTFAKSFACYKKTEFPSIEAFYNDLSGTPCNEADYSEAREFYTKYCTDFESFTKLYQVSDVLMLADIFESYRETSIKLYSMDPCNFVSLPGYSWRAFLVQLYRENPEFKIAKFANQEEMDMFSVRGGVSSIMKKHAKANNKSLADYDPSKPSSYILYVDANSLYPSQMKKYLPSGDFKFVKTKWTTKEIMALKHDADIGYRFKCDFHYPEYARKLLADYPLLAENRPVEYSELSETQLAQLGSEKFNPTTKLVNDFKDKLGYDIDYRLLQFVLSRGVVIKKIHSVISFSQSPFMKNYIDKNINLRATLEGSARDVPKLCMNAIYGKTLQNDLTKCDWTLKNELPKIYKLVQKPNFKDIKHVNNDTFLVNQFKTSVSYDSPRYIGATILDLSKLQMLSTFYELKDKFNLNLLATDTDSLMIEVFHEGSIEDLFKSVPKMDFSNYPKEHPLFSNEFNSQDGYIKDEFCGLVASEFVGLRPKVYSFMIDGKQKTLLKVFRGPLLRRSAITNDTKRFYSRTKRLSIHSRP